MKLLAALLALLGVAAAFNYRTARRRPIRRAACLAWLASQPEPDPTSTVIYTNHPPSWIDPTTTEVRWRAHVGMTMDLILSDVRSLEPCARVVVFVGERDLRDGVPIADVVGDLARLHDHLAAKDTVLEVVSAPRPCGRWGGSVDNLNGEFERLCTQRDLRYLHTVENVDFSSRPVLRINP